ncbi:tyrosine-type recombinase/integrase [Bifidobacterium miconisargentati]|uniref:tyrosine-type recombinase/integrase n=1 Tax=Bifidobacterium miconisargentati TaxID=2834437 RepID=UPI001F25D17D|nr:tyrosine-type recombinase/integrase [Bifidobacterium miconisargentati]
MATTGRRRTKGAGSIIQRADGSWEFRREIDRDPATGKRRCVSAKGRTKADARERFEAKITEMERTGLLPGKKSPYLKDYAQRWLDEYRVNVKPTTYRTRAGRIRACMAVIGYVRLDELTPDHIRKCMRVLSKRLAPSTLKDHFVSLKMMLDQAELEELIPVDPCRRVRPPRVEPNDVRILAPDQPKRLLEAVPNRGAKRRGPQPVADVDESWALLFELAFAAGMREGERYALMPFQLKRRDGVPGIDVCQQIQQYGLPGDVEIPGWLKAEHLYGDLWLTTPKTRAARRFVPVSESLWGRLWARIERLGIGPRQLVFTNSRGNPVRSSTERYNWRKSLKAAGLPMVNVHSARHWTASMTARANMPDDARTAIMNTPASPDRPVHLRGHGSACCPARQRHLIPPLRRHRRRSGRGGRLALRPAAWNTSHREFRVADKKDTAIYIWCNSFYNEGKEFYNARLRPITVEGDLT